MASPVRRSLAAKASTEAAAVFAALGEEHRLRIVARLCHGGPASIARLTEGAGITRQAVTKHLQALQDAGLVRSGRTGRERIWELETRQLAQVQRYLDEISAQWDGTLQRLRAFVEDEEAP